MSEGRGRTLRYEGPGDSSLEVFLNRIESLLQGDYRISRRAVALLLLQEDSEVLESVRQEDPGAVEEVQAIVADARAGYSHALSYVIGMRRQEEVKQILEEVVETPEQVSMPWREKLSRAMMNPILGMPILAAVLYFGLYKFVGGVGAGIIVDFLEGVVFENHVNPFMLALFTRIIPWVPIQELLVGEYGVITLGLRYAVAIILPIVGVFFIAFSIIEDSGYLPRLAMLIDQVFKKIGLSGRAVIPIVLGLGCSTMATMVTRTLPTKRERILATMLLALAVPCAAQMGVLIALFEKRSDLMVIWAVVISFVFLFIGYLAARLMPGERPSFYMEVPPLRLPRPRNVLVKTWSRVKWYFKEIVPLFALASVLIWAGQMAGVFERLMGLLRYPVRAIGLPDEAARIFLFGFFRRDYGAAGLYDLNEQEVLSGGQLLVATVALTLFLPCIAHFLITVRERGLKIGVGISVFVLLFSFAVAYVVHKMLSAAGMMV